MIPGSTTKLSESTLASAASISVKTDLVFLTGTTGVNTIVPNFGGGFSGLVIFVCTDGAVAFGTSGNIAKAATSVQNQALIMVFSKIRGKWYPAAL